MFFDRGFLGTSMEESDEGTGVRHRLFLAAHHDKEQLFLLAFERQTERCVCQVNSALDPIVRRFEKLCEPLSK
jgi:hypothetical protein